jgi:hypothetical protein
MQDRIGTKGVARWLDLGLESGYCQRKVVLVDCQFRIYRVSAASLLSEGDLPGFCRLSP